MGRAYPAGRPVSVQRGALAGRQFAVGAEPFDPAIRRDLDGWPPGLRLQPFLEDEALVVGAPALLRARPVTAPQALVAHVLQAALDGLGLALAPASTVLQDLASGRLQAPLPALRLPLERYYIGQAPDAGPAAQAFLAWLEDGVGA